MLSGLHSERTVGGDSQGTMAEGAGTISEGFAVVLGVTSLPREDPNKNDQT